MASKQALKQAAQSTGLMTECEVITDHILVPTARLG